jgi:hypothetical protein
VAGGERQVGIDPAGPGDVGVQRPAGLVRPARLEAATVVPSEEVVGAEALQVAERVAVPFGQRE